MSNLITGIVPLSNTVYSLSVYFSAALFHCFIISSIIYVTLLLILSFIGDCETMFSKTSVVQNRQSPHGTLPLHCRSQRCKIEVEGTLPNSFYEAKVRRLNTGGGTAPCSWFVCFAQLLSWNNAFRKCLILSLNQRNGPKKISPAWSLPPA